MSEDADLLELLLERWEENFEAGYDIPAQELCRDHPHLLGELERRIRSLRHFNWLSKYRGPDLHLPGAEPLPGYRLVQILGRGGFGEVWHAEGPDKKPVALKFVGVSDKAAKKELEVHSILREIQHPHIVRVHETWITEHAVVLAMEMAQESLQDRLRECPQGLPEDELKGYMVGIADALTMLHQRGIQHRDVKPSNLLLVDGVVKLADFGISRQFANSRTGHTGLLTAQYSPPEFFEGSTSKHSDQYSLAVSYCQLRGGRLPFQGSIAQIIAGHLSKKPDLSMLPERERSAVTIALEKNPEQRWPSCSAFMDAILKGTQTGPARVPVSRRDWLKWGVGGAASLAAVGGMIVARNRLVNGPRLETLSFEPFYHYTSPQTVRSIAHGALQDESLPFILFLNGTGGPTLLNAQTGEVVRRFPMPGGPGAALAPFDIAEGLSSHEKGEIILWDLLKGKEIRPFRNQKASVSAIAYSPDGRQVLSGATDDAVRLFDRKTGEELQCLRGHTGFVMSVAFSTTGTHAFSGSWDGTVRIWNLRTGAMEQTLSGHSSRVWSIGQSWNGKWLISGGQDHLINVWDSVTGSHHLRIESEAPVNSVLSLTPNLILVGTNTHFEIWTMEGQKIAVSPPTPSAIRSMAIARHDRAPVLYLGTSETGVLRSFLPVEFFSTSTS